MRLWARFTSDWERRTANWIASISDPMLAVPANAAKQVLNAPKNLLQDLFGR